MASSKSYARTGEQTWNKMPKMNGELFALTYGAMVMQLIKDYEGVDEVNKQLEKMGYNIGIRLIDEFLAKSGVGVNCQNPQETADVIAKVAFKMFLGVTADVTWNSQHTSFSLTLFDNPLTEFIELPPAYNGLIYSNALCGAIRGALEMVQIRAQCRIVRDTLRGDEVNEIQVEILEHIEESMGEDYNDNS